MAVAARSLFTRRTTWKPRNRLLPQRQAQKRPPYCADVPAPTQPPAKYFLAGHLYVRIYDNIDKARLSRQDLLHWLTYYRFAGVEHVYVYDCWMNADERLADFLQPSIRSGFVTYVDWHEAEMQPQARRDHVAAVEMTARTHCQETYGHEYVCITHTDVDEYPFAPGDTKPDFLSRTLQRLLVSTRGQKTTAANRRDHDDQSDHARLAQHDARDNAAATSDQDTQRAAKQPGEAHRQGRRCEKTAAASQWAQVRGICTCAANSADHAALLGCADAGLAGPAWSTGPAKTRAYSLSLSNCCHALIKISN